MKQFMIRREIKTSELSTDKFVEIKKWGDKQFGEYGTHWGAKAAYRNNEPVMIFLFDNEEDAYMFTKQFIEE